MTRLESLARLGLLAAGLVACEDGQPLVSPPALPVPTTAAEPGPAAVAPSAAAAPAPASQAPDSVIIEAAGAEPRVALIAPVPAFGDQRVRLRLETSMSMHMDPATATPGTEPPPRTVTTATPVIEFDLVATVSPDGMLEVRIDGARSPLVPTKPGAPSVAADLIGLIESSLVSLVGARGSMALLPAPPLEARPTLRLAAPTGTPAHGLELLASLNAALEHFQLRLPAGAVGPGARWTERRPSAVDGVEVNLTRRVHLERMGAGTAHLAFDVALDAGSRGKLEVGGKLVAGAALSGTGKGTMGWTPGRPLPTSGFLELESVATRVESGREALMTGTWRLKTVQRLTWSTR